MIRDFKAFGGRSVIHSLVSMFIFIIVFMGVGLFFNYSFPEAPEDDTSVSDEMFDTLEQEKSNTLDVFIPNFILGYFSFFVGSGVITNSCFKIDGSKWVRTMKNSRKRYINAYNFTIIINLAFVLLTSTLLYLCFLIHSILNSGAGSTLGHYPPIWAGYITAIGGALLSSGICSILIRIKKDHVRLIVMTASVILAAFGVLMFTLFFDIFFSEITGNDNVLTFLPLITLVVGVIAFTVGYVIFISTVKKRWLFE